MTMTCQRCNNDLGSRVEVDLQRWFDHALVGARLAHEGDVQGPRRLPPAYLLKGGDGTEGTFGLFIDGDPGADIDKIVNSGEWTMEYREPNRRRYKLALLKHAYLAACLYFQGIPDSPTAAQIRADLLAARDSRRNEAPPVSEIADSLHVYRSGVGTQGPSLALVANMHEDTSAPSSTEDGTPEPEVLISLAGALFVSWPLPDAPPGRWEDRPAGKHDGDLAAGDDTERQ